MTELSMAQTVIALLEGVTYASVVKVILLCGVVPVVLARCWCAVARSVMHPDSRALAHLLRLGFIQVNRQLANAGRYPLAPVTEHRLRRLTCYGDMVVCGSLSVGFLFCGLILLVAFGIYLYYHLLFWSVYAMLAFCGAAVVGLFPFAAAKRAWHRLQTGEGLPGPLPAG